MNTEIISAEKFYVENYDPQEINAKLLFSFAEAYLNHINSIPKLPPQESEDIDNSGTEFLKGVLQSGEGEKFLEDNLREIHIGGNLAFSEQIITQTNAVIYAQMKVAEETKILSESNHVYFTTEAKLRREIEQLNSDNKKICEWARETYGLELSEFLESNEKIPVITSLLKIANDEILLLKSELEQLKVVSSVEGVVVSDEEIDQINVGIISDYNKQVTESGMPSICVHEIDAPQIVSFMNIATKEMRDRLMPMIRKGEDSPIGFVHWLWDKGYEVRTRNNWGIPEEASECLPDLLKEFLSRRRDDGGKV